MNILQIGTADNKGGAASISWSIKNKLEEKGHKTSMFVSIKKSNHDNVFRIPRNLNKYIHFILSNDTSFSKTDYIINTKEFKESDIIHLHNLHGWYFNLKTLYKISKLKPIIWTLHDMWSITPFCAYSYGGTLKNGFYQCPSLRSYPPILCHNEKYLMKRKKEIYNKSSFDLVVTSKWLEYKVKNSVLENRKRYLIYNGINQNTFKSDLSFNYREKLGLDRNKKIILFLSDGGKNNPAKGWSYVKGVIKNFKNRNDLLFLCIGGREKGYDEKYKNLLYISRINNKKILASYFSASDLFLFPTLADNCPLTVLEAMSCGVPIVTFKTGGVPELVKHLKNGYVANYKDLDDLINGVKYILSLSNDEILKVKQRSINDILSNFTVDKMVNQYIDVYQKKINDFR